MTYAKPEVHEIGAAAEIIQGPFGVGCDTAQMLPCHLTFEDSNE